MRRFLLGLLTTVAAAAVLGAPLIGHADTYGEAHGRILPGEASHRVRLNRSFWDQVGPRLDIPSICGPAGAAKVEQRRNGWDAIAGVLTVGLYTPTHAKVVCNPPAGQAPLSLR